MTRSATSALMSPCSEVACGGGHPPHYPDILGQAVAARSRRAWSFVMGRRKTKVSLHPIGDGKLVDITDQYSELPAGSVARRAIVDDPSGGRQVIALRQIRDDPLGDLHSRGRIDDVLFRAGREWQRWYEIAQPSGLRCILGSGVVVAGGNGPRDSISDQADSCGSMTAALGGCPWRGSKHNHSRCSRRRSIISLGSSGARH